MEEVTDFISSIDNETRKLDSIALLAILEKVSGYKPYLSGSIIGFGSYHYKYDSGREGDSAVIAFSPRKQNLVVYIMPGFEKLESLLQDLGKHKLGKSCLYINKLSDLNLDILEQIAKLSVQFMQQKYKCINT
ncbi:DUF1801 domain-containing protein [Thalassotalea nanhaiensis]|uniref:DUF1801 domain-containing protein n=1 Tax=Thalassotalea nanhaiensis TaxID=3065648 RepID=A0ABY9TH77_9GAMM|nr:DUF1801 domain-containing protein [Colwelliaceae bacterium SQ345]